MGEYVYDAQSQRMVWRPDNVVGVSPTTTAVNTMNNAVGSQAINVQPTQVAGAVAQNINPNNFSINYMGTNFGGQYAQNIGNVMKEMGLDPAKFGSYDKQVQGMIMNQAGNLKPDAMSLQGAFGQGGWATGALQGIGTLGSLYMG